MNPAPKPSQMSQTSLFQVYLRLRPPISPSQSSKDAEPERCLVVDSPAENNVIEDMGQGEQGPAATHITLQPPADSRKRAVERFGFTKVFEEHASQLDVFRDTGLEETIKGVMLEGRDGLVATLGVTGSGKVWISATYGNQKKREQRLITLCTEPYDPGIEVTERYYSDGPGCDFQISRAHDQTPRELD